MNKVSIGLAVAVALFLVTFSVVGRAAAPGPDPPHLVSMEASGRAMQQAGAAMRAHGQAMLDEGRRAGDQELIAHGEHWLRDGQDVADRGRWMAMDPAAEGNLGADRGGLTASGDWAGLVEYARAMQHDPHRVQGTDLEALRWNGLAMRGEGENMVEHGRLMVDEVALMIAQHRLDEAAAAELRQATEALREAGEHLRQNGQAMIDYADRQRRGMGFR